MASGIDDTVPANGAAGASAPIRGNFATAKSEISALQTAVAAAGDFKSDGTVAMTGALVNTQAVAATSTDGIVLATTATATAGAQKWSPRLRWSGSGWKTNATAAAQVVDWIAELQPVQGTTAPTGKWALSGQVNGGAYTEAFSVDLLGNITTGNGVATTGNITIPRASFLKFASSSQIYSDINAQSGAIQFLNLAGNACWGTAHPAGINTFATGYFGFSNTSNATGSADTALYRNASGVVEINNGTAGTFRDLKLRNLLAGGGNGSYVQTPSMTVANLASAATAGAGARAFVTDATATTFLSVVAGGGANKVPVVSDGTNWLIG